jgi:hypothetical protein
MHEFDYDKEGRPIKTKEEKRLEKKMKRKIKLQKKQKKELYQKK